MLVMAEGTAGSMMFMPSRLAFSLVSLFSLVSARDLFAAEIFFGHLRTMPEKDWQKNQGSKIRLLLEI